MLTDEARQSCGDLAYYPGHPITLACQIARAFPTMADASASTPHGWAAALSSDKVEGAGGCVYAALGALDRLHKGESLESVIAWADSCCEYPFRADWPAACVQARRYLERVDLVSWVKA